MLACQTRCTENLLILNPTIPANATSNLYIYVLLFVFLLQMTIPMMMLLLLLSPILVMGFPGGAPIVQYPEICQTMFPIGHKVAVQTGVAPYSIQLSDTCYKAGDKIQGE